MWAQGTTVAPSGGVMDLSVPRGCIHIKVCAEKNLFGTLYLWTTVSVCEFVDVGHLNTSFENPCPDFTLAQPTFG